MTTTPQVQSLVRQKLEALFGHSQLPHRSTLSRFLAALDQTAVEALRSVFLQDAASSPWIR